MRHLALDVGDERIGVAISDNKAYLARPLEVVRRVAGESSFRHIAGLVSDNQVGTIVVGQPLLPDGTPGKQVESTRCYVDRLREFVTIPIVFWDERYSTQRATQIMVQNGTKRKRRRIKDQVAAAVILQSYLDAQSEGRGYE